MKRTNSGALLLLGAWLAVGGASCAGSAASEAQREGLVITQVPAGAARAAAELRPDPAARYPAGSRILWLESPGDFGSGRVLSAGFHAAGAPALSADADRVLFAGLREPEGPWAIYETGVRRGRPSRIGELATDCVDPAYLADGRIVFSCRVGAAAWALFTVRPDGSDLDRITWTPGSAFHPSPLPDGRLVFALEQGAGQGRPPSGHVALFTSLPDGTLFEPLAGSHAPPESRVRPRATGDGAILFLAGSATAAPVLERLELSRPQDPTRRLDLGLPVLSAEPDGDGLLLATAGGIYRRLPGATQPELLFDDPERDEIEVLPWRPRAVPKKLPSPLDRSRSTGILVCYDAARGDGRIGPAPGDPRPATVEIETWNGSGGSGTTRRFAVESDASFQVEVPADTPLRLRTLDAEGSPITRSDWLWVRPGEVRACFGCHESRHSAPVNRLVAALTRGPAEPLTDPEGAGR